MNYVYADIVIKVKCRYIVLYGLIQNIYKMKFMLNFLNRNTYRHMYIILKYNVYPWVLVRVKCRLIM